MGAQAATWAASEIGTLRAAADAVRSHAYSLRLAGLEGEKATEFPPPNCGVKDAVHAISEGLPSAQGKLIGRGNHKPVRGVGSGDDPFRRQIVLVLHGGTSP